MMCLVEMLITSLLWHLVCSQRSSWDTWGDRVQHHQHMHYMSYYTCTSSQSIWTRSSPILLVLRSWYFRPSWRSGTHRWVVHVSDMDACRSREYVLLPAFWRDQCLRQYEVCCSGRIDGFWRRLLRWTQLEGLQRGCALGTLEPNDALEFILGTLDLCCDLMASFGGVLVKRRETLFLLLLSYIY